MLKKAANFLVFISVIITVSHNMVAHHHDFETTEIPSHQHHEEDQSHSIFSFGQLDESFIFSHYYNTITNDVATTLFFIPFNEFSLPVCFYKCKTDFIAHPEFSPPEDHFHSTSYRGPPIV